MMLDSIRVVLVGTTHPGNIGAAARAMKNMGLSRLCLVQPRVFPHAEATARASGADDLLALAEVFDTLDEAVAGCSFVLGASARRRAIPWPEVDAREAGSLAVRETGQGRAVALVFGREHSGLTNEELERCHRLVHIPTNPDYSSLNLAAAVQVLAYETRMAARPRTADEAPSMPIGDPPATADEIEGFYAHLERLLVRVAFLDPANPRHLMRRLRRLFTRAGLERTEVNILRGILTETEKHLRGKGKD